MEGIEEYRAGMRKELDEFLRKLEKRFGYPHDYKIEWIQLDGEFDHPKKGKCAAFTYDGKICIRTTSLDKAKSMLVHEFIEEVLVLEFTAPYNRLLQTILGYFDAEGYIRREQFVNRLTRTILKEMIDNGE